MNERVVITHRLAGGFIETTNKNVYVRIDENCEEYEDIEIIFEEVVDMKGIMFRVDEN